MSRQYDEYLKQHRTNVLKGYRWLDENLPELFHDSEELIEARWQVEFAHDQSKEQLDEYAAYDAYFYGGNRSYAVVHDFRMAWLLHIHRNPHHWQYWVLINDDPEEGEIIIDMPHNYILEMICDWWAFSWADGDLTEIFGWYDQHKDYMKLGDSTRLEVEDILAKIQHRLMTIGNETELMHHGIKGQKWGIRRDKDQLAKSRSHDTIKRAVIAEEKFTKYALDPEKDPNKAKAFKKALGYTKDNCEQLIRDVNSNFDPDKLEERGDLGHGMRYQQIMCLRGVNEKEANVLTAWIREEDSVRLTSVYVTKKEEEQNEI